MSESFNPYHQWLGIPPKDQPTNYYRLLGVDIYEGNPDVIANAADRQMKHVRSFQTGQRARAAQQILTEISAAKVNLLNPAKKAAYDAFLLRLAEQDEKSAQAIDRPVEPVVDDDPLGPTPVDRNPRHNRPQAKDNTTAFAVFGLAVAISILTVVIGAGYAHYAGWFRMRHDSPPITMNQNLNLNGVGALDGLKSESKPIDPIGDAPNVPNGPNLPGGPTKKLDPHQTDKSNFLVPRPQDKKEDELQDPKGNQSNDNSASISDSSGPLVEVPKGKKMKAEELIASEPIPDELKNATGYFTGLAGATVIRVLKPTKVYVAASWGSDGSGGDWEKEIWQNEQFLENGWEEVGKVEILLGKKRDFLTKHTLYVRDCSAGEELRVRTRKHNSPSVFVPGNTNGTPPAGSPVFTNAVEVTKGKIFKAEDLIVSDPIPEVLKNGTGYFTGLTGATDIRVLKPTRVYVAASWGSDGSGGEWEKEIWQKEQFLENGWQEVGNVDIMLGKKRDFRTKHILFVRDCATGEELRIRTRKHNSPSVFIPAESL